MNTSAQTPATSAHPARARPEKPNFQGGDAPSLWADEAIWGHRLYDEQTPWLSVLECLGIAYAELRHSRAFAESPGQRLAYSPLQQLRLRNILFNNPKMSLLAERGGADDECWRSWEAEMRTSAGGLQEPDFSYVRRHFQTFRDFVSVVQFLRSSTVEGVNNKRWSSQFLFPFGPSALYEDLNVVGTSVTVDRRFFGRTGELLYLMLCRGGRAAELRDAVCGRFLGSSLTYGRLVSVLQGPDQPSANMRAGSYLPYLSVPEFRQLSEDWLAILSRSLPGYDALPHLVTITGLHLILYLLRRARIEAGDPGPVTLVAEMVSRRRTVVRDLSANSYSQNNLLPERALTRWIGRITETAEWQRALLDGDPLMSAKGVLQDVFNWPDEDDEDVRAAATPVALLDALHRRAVDRHRQHLAKVLPEPRSTGRTNQLKGAHEYLR